MDTGSGNYLVLIGHMLFPESNDDLKQFTEEYRLLASMIKSHLHTLGNTNSVACFMRISWYSVLPSLIPLSTQRETSTQYPIQGFCHHTTGGKLHVSELTQAYLFAWGVSAMKDNSSSSSSSSSSKRCSNSCQILIPFTQFSIPIPIFLSQFFNSASFNSCSNSSFWNWN